jgi:hypothetical protein
MDEQDDHLSASKESAAPWRTRALAADMIVIPVDPGEPVRLVADDQAVVVLRREIGARRIGHSSVRKLWGPVQVWVADDRLRGDLIDHNLPAICVVPRPRIRRPGCRRGRRGHELRPRHWRPLTRPPSCSTTSSTSRTVTGRRPRPDQPVVHPALRAATARRSQSELDKLARFKPTFGIGALDSPVLGRRVRRELVRALTRPGDRAVDRWIPASPRISIYDNALSGGRHAGV